MSHLGDNITERRRAYYERIAQLRLRPLWEVLHALVPREPQPKCQPAIWNYQALRGPLLEAGELISAQEATRRVLILENPAFPGESRITNTLYCGLQLLKSGEIAPAHRHTQSALRFVLEGQGAFTAVEGERHYMAPGDLVLTPAWTWHDHGGAGSEPVIWLDGLDIPLLQMFDASFSEDLGVGQQPIARPPGDAQARYGANMLPVDYKGRPRTSPLFAYPYSRTREALEGMSRGAPAHPCHGHKMRYINPATGGHALPTIAAFMQLLPRGFSGSAFRSTDATVYVAVEGGGCTYIGTQSYPWERGDILVVPSWHWCRHEANQDAVLFSCSDRGVQEQLGIWREANQ